MKLSGKNILIVSPEPWSHLFVSKHHYAVNLAKTGNKVFFLNPPTKKWSINKTDFEGVEVIDYSGFPKGMRYFLTLLRHWFTRKVYRKLEDLSETKFDIIWSFDNSVFYDFDALPSALLKISHIVDLNQDFETERAARSADICFCTTQLIKSRLDHYAPNKVFWINHGLNKTKDGIKTFTLPGSNPIKAIYAGNLAMKYLDWQIVARAVMDNPSVDFVFFGSNSNDTDIARNPMHCYKNEVIGKPNTYFLGQLTSDELGHALNAADVLLLCYQEAYHQDQANPHKVLEYLFTGKPIVATFTGEYQDAELMYMTKSNVEWPNLLKEVIKDLPKHTSPDLLKKRQDFALDNTYEMQIERIEAHLSKL